MSKKLNLLKQTQKNFKNEFHILNLNFFHSNLKKSYNIKNIVFNNKKTIYREIYFFYRRIKDYVMIKKKRYYANKSFDLFSKIRFILMIEHAFSKWKEYYNAIIKRS